MQVQDAQREVRSVYLGGSVGQFVSGALWLASAAIGTWGSRRSAILALVVGGMFIFPVTTLVLKAMGRRAALSRENPLGALATQIAFTVPLSLPLVGAAALHRIDWFYPATMIVVGAHYLPFTFLYGMGLFAVLAGVLISGGLCLGLYLHAGFTAGGWGTGLALCLFAVVCLIVGRRDAGPEAAPGVR
ncbi:MAG: hypothetical protein E6K81_02160 [Candidatus Eisenbacteria bacterium]|uniref:Uncharacterized protein n=1 Tax=Eiseniibacteriota bacterium TaxID=2212470 RepID=A0A538UDE3_UNCEI|nr:MAG: hypothetical protein E6K81_02160 [Candidatus Eisenbacteria bacterium]